ncbi:darcynin family protein [Sphaerisporangium fuscum]|uniref:darcynin family protein n=1 Tax=Sphaerisporangium fuscum TaxID=2835868 RepID=UPI0035589505
MRGRSCSSTSWISARARADRVRRTRRSLGGVVLCLVVATSSSISNGYRCKFSYNCSLMCGARERALSVEQRMDVFRTEIVPAITSKVQGVRSRFYDTEFYSARVTDAGCGRCSGRPGWTVRTASGRHGAAPAGEAGAARRRVSVDAVVSDHAS